MTAQPTGIPRTSDRSRTHHVVDSPLGPLTLVSQDGALIGVYVQQQRHAPDPARYGDRAADAFPAVTEQLDAYFAGQLTDFDLPVLLIGTEFSRRVWAELQRIPYGETTSYGDLARRIGQPTASRAVGLANGRNPISIVVPCHRVIGANGNLVGYGGGLDRKRYLLDLERGRTQPTLPAAVHR